MIQEPANQPAHDQAQQDALNSLNTEQEALWDTTVNVVEKTEKQAINQRLKSNARITTELRSQAKKDNKIKNQHTFNSKIDRQQGHIRHNIIRTALAQELTLPDNIMTQAIIAGNLELVQLLKYKNYPLNADDYATAATNKHFSQASWILTVIEKNAHNREQIITSAAASRQALLIHQAKNYFPMTDETRLDDIKIAIRDNDLNDVNLLIANISADSFSELVTLAYQQKNALILHAVLQQWPTRDLEDNGVEMPGDLYHHIIEQYKQSRTELTTTIQACTRTTKILCWTFLSLAALGFSIYTAYSGDLCMTRNTEKNEKGEEDEKEKKHHKENTLCYIQVAGGVLGSLFFAITSLSCLFYYAVDESEKTGPLTLIRTLREKKTLYDSHIAMFNVLATNHLQPSEQDLTALANNTDGIIPNEMKARLEEIAGNSLEATAYRRSYCWKFFEYLSDNNNEERHESQVALLDHRN